MAEAALRAMKQVEDKENDMTYSFAAMSDLHPHQKTLLEKVGLLKQKRTSTGGPEIVHFLVGRTVANAESFSIPMNIIRLSKSPLVRALRSGDQIRVEARKRIFKVCLKYLESGSASPPTFPDPDIAPREFISLAVLANMFGLDSLLRAIENSPLTPSVLSADLQSNSGLCPTDLIGYSSKLLERLSSPTGAGSRLLGLIEDYLISSVRFDADSVPRLILLSYRHKLNRLSDLVLKSKVIGSIDAWNQLRCDDSSELAVCALMVLCAVVEDKGASNLAALALRQLTKAGGTRQTSPILSSSTPVTIPIESTVACKVPVEVEAPSHPIASAAPPLRNDPLIVLIVAMISILVYYLTRN